MTAFDARLNLLASRQHGLVRTGQVEPGEVDRLRHMVRRGLASHVGKGVYRLAGVPDTWMQRLTASVWVLGESAVVSHAAACRVFGLDGFTTEEIEITIERSRRGRALPDIVTRSRIPVHTTTFRLEEDTVRRAGLPVTSPERTVLDLARAGRPRAQIEAAIDSAIRLRLTDLDRLTERLSYLGRKGRWNAATIQPLLLTSGGHTFLERRLLKLLAEAGLPLPEPQVEHWDGGRHVARVDFLYPRAGVVIEVSGGRGHSSPSERAKDYRRRMDLERLGRVVLEFTYEQVMREPAYVVATIRETLLRRAT